MAQIVREPGEPLRVNPLRHIVNKLRGTEEPMHPALEFGVDLFEQDTLTPIPIPNIAKVFSKGFGAKNRFTGPFYHGTHDGVLSDIMKDGLRPPGGEFPTFGGYQQWGIDNPGVYLSRDPDTAYEYAHGAVENWQDSYLDELLRPVVLRVDELPTHKFNIDEDAITTGANLGYERATKRMGSVTPDEIIDATP